MQAFVLVPVVIYEVEPALFNIKLPDVVILPEISTEPVIDPEPPIYNFDELSLGIEVVPIPT